MAFLIYMITTFTLYVPDWSFVDRFNGDEPKRYTVHNQMSGPNLCSIFINLKPFVFLPFIRSFVG